MGTTVSMKHSLRVASSVVLAMVVTSEDVGKTASMATALTVDYDAGSVPSATDYLNIENEYILVQKICGQIIWKFKGIISVFHIPEKEIPLFRNTDMNIF